MTYDYGLPVTYASGVYLRFMSTWGVILWFTFNVMLKIYDRGHTWPMYFDYDTLICDLCLWRGVYLRFTPMYLDYDHDLINRDYDLC